MTSNVLWLAFSIVVLACFAAGWIYRRVRRSRARTWPQREGRITSTDVRLEGSGGQQAYIADIRYSYTVDGAAYNGHLRRRFLLHNSAHKWVDGYSNRHSVMLRYNPQDVSDSMLLETEQN